ncbi:MAG: biopolymer transporter ExbD [Myxococcales bacterium]
MADNSNPLDPSVAPSANPAEGEVPEISEEQRSRMTYKKLIRRKRRKEREAAGEIRELNITAMMDMMTIILVFLLKSYSATSVNMASSGDVAPPISTTRLAPKDTVSVTVTRCSPGPEKACRVGSGALMVGDKTILQYEGDAFPANVKVGGETGLLVEPLREALQKEVDKIKYIAQYNPAVQFTGELSVVGDRNMPYRMLTEILYTAGQVELDSYRFVVIKREGSGGEGGAPAAGGEG